MQPDTSGMLREPRGMTGAAAPVSTAGLRFPERLIHELRADQLDRLLLWCASVRASDIVLCPGDPVWIQVDGVWQACTDSAVSDAETQNAVNITTLQPGRAGYVRSGKSADYAYSVRVPGSRTARQRFRVNATSTTKGVYVVLRVLPDGIPSLRDMPDLEPGIVQALFPESGLVCVSGVMGSGKSTLLAAAVGEALRRPGRARQVLTLEDPVEFDFSSIPWTQRQAPVSQSAVHIDVQDWPSGVRALTRRKGEIVMVGECRDAETVDALCSVTEQGVAAYTTVHATGVAQTIGRMVNAFPEARRDAAAAVLRDGMRLIVHQRLVPRRRTPAQAQAGVPGRIALREFLAFDAPVRRALAGVPAHALADAVDRLVRERGQSLADAARRLARTGAISGEILKAVLSEGEDRSQSEARNSHPAHALS